MSTVPELLKLTEPPAVVVPALADLRKVAALSLRPSTKPLKVKLAGLWTWNNAPARLVITPPDKPRLPAPVQSTVPPFSRVRVFSCTAPGLETLSVAPAARTVRPLPLIVPDVHTKVPRTVSVPLPVRVGVVATPPNVTSVQSAHVFRVKGRPVVMTTVSCELGARLGVRLVAALQSPLARLVQMKRMGVKRA